MAESARQSKGDCAFCGRKLTRTGMAKHLAACEKRLEAVAAANAKGGKKADIFHLQVQDAWEGQYWLHLEMDGNAALERLDHYLRSIWLECCGHMSRFSVGDWRGEDIDPSTKAARTFKKVKEVTHQYDFGTTSETLIKVLGVRQGKPLDKNPLYLMARNDAPKAMCTECERLATQFCVECVIEEDREGTLCDRHAEEHPHDNYGDPLPWVNSPRVGMCGYCGPAEPPY